MRVAVDATPLLGQRTGIATFVDGVLTALSERGDVDVHAYAVSARGFRALGRSVPAGMSTTARPVPAALLLRMWAASGHPTASLVVGRRVDVVHGTNFVVPPAPGSGEVVTVHDLTAVRYPELCSSTTRQYPELVRRAVRRGAWVHTPSAFVAAEVVDLLGAPADRVVAIPHGVRLLPPSGPSPVSGRYIVALGTVEPRKDLPLLVRAFTAISTSHPDVRLVIAGPDGWGSEALGAAIAASPAVGRIVRVGYVAPGRREALLAGAAAYCYPSVYEGFGLPPLEAMALGVPVVTTSAGAVPEVVGDAAAVVPVGDVDALAGALDRALRDVEWRNGLVERGRDRARGFRWEDTAERLVELYGAAAR